ncbi:MULTISPECIES: DUF6750 family protein [unclassified Pseudomonas]|uniref:DUF6750 family protein n=1 Tax=unclassified Pseudomonas TaxID=196821 RepID=UPI000C2FC7AF|nr:MULTISPECIES: DUF6750 family protein [unclassified Pseudomonas]MCU1737533.1 hypothetical protein [Pseudomonas sp. 20S_6.2_Bac1]
MKINPVEYTADLGRRVHIGLQNWCDKHTAEPAQRQIMLSTAAITFAALTFSMGASAGGEGFAGMLDTGATQADSGSNSLARIFKFLGFGGAAYGGFNWWKKGQDGARSDIKATQIFIPILAGAGIGGIGYLMGKAGETVGMATSTYGQVPQ